MRFTLNVYCQPPPDRGRSLLSERNHSAELIIAMKASSDLWTSSFVGMLALIALAASPIDVLAAPRPRFTVTDLGTLPGGYDTLPTKINNRGQAVGSTYTADGSRVPFIYSQGTITPITGISGAGVALDINDSGAVVGQIGTRAFLFRDGVMTDLNPLFGLDWVAASGINHSGDIVGWAFPVNGANTAFLLNPSGIQFLPFLPGPAYLNTAYEINDAGQAVGDCVFIAPPGEPARARAVLYQQGTAHDLGTLPGGTYSLGRAINAAGHVVGWSGLNYVGPDVLNATHAFLYRDGQMIDLGVLPGDSSSYANDVNNNDWVVGTSEGPAEIHRAFLHANGKLYDLNDLIKRNSGWVLSGATGVNDHGQIVGYSLNLDTRAIRGFLLTPEKSRP